MGNSGAHVRRRCAGPLSRKTRTPVPAVENRGLLIVDNDLAWRHSAARIFEDHGFDVSTASNAKQAMRYLRKRPPRYALIDFRIGNDACLRVVEQAAKVEPPVCVVVLADASVIAAAMEAVDLGAARCLIKPVRFDDIVMAFWSEAQKGCCPT